MPKCGRRSDLNRLSVDMRQSQDFSHLLAPFGNQFTPPSRIKIIGGKPVTIDEVTPGAPVRRQKPRHALQPITDKPNHIDPRLYSSGEPALDIKGVNLDNTYRQNANAYQHNGNYHNDNIASTQDNVNYHRDNYRQTNPTYNQNNTTRNQSNVGYTRDQGSVHNITPGYTTNDQDHFQSHVHPVRKSPSPRVNPFSVIPPIHVTDGLQRQSVPQTFRSSDEIPPQLNNLSDMTVNVSPTQQHDQTNDHHQRRGEYKSSDRPMLSPSNHRTYYYENSPVAKHETEQPVEVEERNISPQQKSHLRYPFSLHDLTTGPTKTERIISKITDYTPIKNEQNKNFSKIPYNELASNRLGDPKEYLTGKYLVPGDYLPRDTVNYSPDDNRQLMLFTKKEMRNFNVDILKTVYMDMANIDRNLTGWCGIRDLSFVLGKNKVIMAPELIRLIAAGCVSAFQPLSQVNYEKFLTYIADSLSADTEVDTSDRHPSPTHAAPGHASSRDTETVELLRTIEDTLAKYNYDIDIEELTRRFQAEDRTHRGTLSIRQITDVCHKVGLPLHTTLIDRILERCDRNVGAQYSWVHFVSFLERVQPIKTGLHIPTSKRPLEYAKLYPTPTDNWPKSRDHSPSSRKLAIPQLTHHREPTRDIEPMRLSPREPSPELQNKESEIVNLEKQLLDMKKAYAHLKYELEKPDDDPEPWFQRYLKMANAVYAQDVTNSGQLSYDQLREVVTLYNKAYTLRIPETKIERAMMDNYLRGKITIHPFLTALGVEGNK